MWMNYQVAFELALAAKEDRDVERRAKIYSKVPVRDLKKRQWIPDATDVEDLEQAVCKFLDVAHIDDTPQFSMAARKSSTYDYDTPSQIAWYARARHLAHAAPAARFVDSDLETAIVELRKLAKYPEDARMIPKVLADFGIRLLLIEHLPKSLVEGVAFWINDGTSPVIALSLRYDRIDNLWHNLMHEMVHIKYRDQPVIDVEPAPVDDAELPEIEKRANSEASDYLVPRERMDSFIQRHGRIISAADITRAAQARGVHPGIFAGQLQGRGALDFKCHWKLRVKIRSEIVGEALTDGWGNVPRI
jgi:HTH-type transcriptional regulator/antitoxin HigA